MSDNMRLPKFLNDVDALAEGMSKEDLLDFIHEMARTWPESRRDGFKQLLESFDSRLSGSVNVDASDDGYTQLGIEINSIKKKMEDINSGKRCLESEYNEEWDDWYNSDAEEILFSDPKKLLNDINSAITIIHRCIDMEVYDKGSELAEILSVLEVYANGDYNDYDGTPLGIHELYDHDLLSGDFDQVVKECLYLTYIGNKLSDRADEIYCMIGNFGHYTVRLEDVLQTGNRELPEFDEFLKLWTDYLGNQKGRRAEELLKEAQSMLHDDFSMLENARKFVKTHPSLYMQLLEMNLKAGEDRKMLEIGLEALDSIPSVYCLEAELHFLQQYMQKGYAHLI